LKEKKMKKLEKILFFSIIIFCFMPCATAFSADAFDSVVEKGIEVFKNVRRIVFVLGGFGLMAASVGAIFGKLNWKWYGGLLMGLMILAVAGAIIDYTVEDSISGVSSWQSKMEDPLEETSSYNNPSIYKSGKKEKGYNKTYYW
jgi:cell division protein FtsW (lipid II flippase)